MIKTTSILIHAGNISTDSPLTKNCSAFCVLRAIEHTLWNAEYTGPRPFYIKQVPIFVNMPDTLRFPESPPTSVYAPRVFQTRYDMEQYLINTVFRKIRGFLRYHKDWWMGVDEDIVMIVSAATDKDSSAYAWRKCLGLMNDGELVKFYERATFQAGITERTRNILDGFYNNPYEPWQIKLVLNEKRKRVALLKDAKLSTFLNGLLDKVQQALDEEPVTRNNRR